METRLITPEAIISYPHLFEPYAGMNGGDPKYSATLIFPAGTDLKPLKAAVVEAAQEKFGAKAAAMLKGGKIRLPFRDDGEEKGYPEGSTFINVRSPQRPGVVAAYADPRTGKPAVITDPEVVYPGQIVRASITAFGYDVSGNKGVAFGLNNVQILRDGDRLDSRRAAADEFSAVADAPDLSDLEGADDPLGALGVG